MYIHQLHVTLVTYKTCTWENMEKRNDYIEIIIILIAINNSQ
jgi:hypothetical protein